VELLDVWKCRIAVRAGRKKKTTSVAFPSTSDSDVWAPSRDFILNGLKLSAATMRSGMATEAINSMPHSTVAALPNAESLVERCSGGLRVSTGNLSI
jgi:hypothetical protein